MSSNFKYIVIFIIASLLAVFAVQLFWMKGLYNSIEQETQKQVQECIKEANSRELAYRIDSLEKSTDENKFSGYISVSHSTDREREISDNVNETLDREFGKTKLQKTKELRKGQDTIHNVSSIDEEEFSLAKFEYLGNIVRETVHQTLDSVAPISLDTLHAALLIAFKEKNINASIYNIEIVKIDENNVLNGRNFETSAKEPFVQDFLYDSNNQLIYRVYMQSLTQTVLGQMLGILSTTLIIIFILAWAFAFLIRTVFKLKTLDEMKEDFTSNMTHELKTPIAVAYSATDVLLNFGVGEDKEKRKMYLSVCKEQLEKLTDLVEQILSMSTERRLKLVLEKEDVGLKDMLISLAEQHKIKADKDINISLNISPENLMVHADKTHLNNILSNLIDNAIKYSGETVNVNITACEQDGYSIIKIKDNGIGIAGDKLKYLFDKFYRVPQGNKHNIKGYGIGLFYVQTIIDKHQGSIEVTSAQGVGTEFTIKILTVK